MSEEQVGELSEWLLRRGFSLIETRETGGFENILMRFQGDGCEVWATRERGIWSVGIAPPGSSRDMASKIWRCYLDGVEPDVSAGPDSIDVDISFVYERLGEVSLAIQRDSDIGERLVDINWIFVKARLGLDPDMPMPGNPGFGKP
ncbi:hypothetical protein ACIQPR_04280 [Streptomyces sp. NPDC091280]|uniref:hypothetical protein n=1 Tax=Streptomyces sp. NPDC091280 TaxID=3365984 RepID=UPI003818791E